MRYLALAVDFDGTLATDGHVLAPTVDALQRVRASGRRLVMVTGRELGSLRATFSRLHLFDIVVAENGGLLYRPSMETETALAPPPLPAFVEALRARGVPVSVGATIVATWDAHAGDVYAVLRDLRLGLEVILNKGAVMVLAPGVNKGTGVARAAAELSLSLDAVIGMGDAENDYTLLRSCGLGVAVANAVPLLREQADLVTHGARGEGVTEIVDRLLADDLESLVPAKAPTRWPGRNVPSGSLG
jgi:hydroxymethylpyrimidine pyrophosphatase-like HAD family hydrolase